MHIHILIAIALCTAAAATQQRAALVQPVGIAEVITRAAGLQADPGGDGLLGFGASYFARLGAQGVHFEVTTAPGAAPACVELSPPVVRRGRTVEAIVADVGPDAMERRATYRRAQGIDERFDVGPDGIELSWRFAERPAGDGDLLVRYAVETSLAAPTARDGGLQFAGEHGGVSIGRVRSPAAPS